MARINQIVAMMIKLDKKISAGAVARVINGQSLKIDLVV